ncbi:MAG: methyltransferase domain-containing protein [Patescibacteria group bacterium]|jgi:SAM-dependent methyltransferase
MAVETHIYDNRFFRNTIKLEASSAFEFTALVLKYYTPASLVDIGCGAGIYLKEFNKKGIKNLLGLDGSPAAGEEFLLDKHKLVIFDLAKKYKFKKKYDLALCLEVAEHLREKDADVLIETITEAADNIIFSAAVPGQGSRSIGHINEQPHNYWIEKFKNKNFSYLKLRTEKMRAEMKARGVVWWIVNNLMIFELKRTA